MKAPSAAFFFFFFFLEPEASSRNKLQASGGSLESKHERRHAMEARTPHHGETALRRHPVHVLLQNEHGRQVACDKVTRWSRQSCGGGSEVRRRLHCLRRARCPTGFERLCSGRWGGALGNMSGRRVAREK
jgi:hypothetical protein